MPPDQLAMTNPEAVALYRTGLALLRRGFAAEAIPVLRGAVAIDPRFALATAALAVAEARVGCEHWRTTIGRATAEREISRRERQHVAVVALALTGDPVRASALGQEHLHEFPGDSFVADVVTALTGTELDAQHVVE